MEKTETQQTVSCPILKILSEDLSVAPLFWRKKKRFTRQRISFVSSGVRSIRQAVHLLEVNLKAAFSVNIAQGQVTRAGSAAPVCDKGSGRLYTDAQKVSVGSVGDGGISYLARTFSSVLKRAFGRLGVASFLFPVRVLHPVSNVPVG